ncbi:CPBP family glutamic-type intramembrane protease [Flavobacterium sp. W22_SRS_FP1]|uniref:CPBP family glutamic-type intramembrane protease n=1 Tax=Flavobacterium sp. W22_SRS_FP1 TaxID=3240276 RepID=UPI003F93DE30
MTKFSEIVTKNAFLKFINNPYQKSNRNFKKDFTIFIFLTILNFLVLFIASLYTSEPFIEESDLKLYNIEKIFPYLILIPLIEEFSYRGFLRFKNKKIFIISVIAVITLLATFIKVDIYRNSSIIVIMILTCFIYFQNQLYEKFLLYIDSYLKYLIWISSIIFGLMHLSNFNNFEYVNLLGITEKIIAGLFFCYITGKYNIFYSYFFHALNNSLPFFIIICYKLIP